jgi:hypothetical protein
MVSQDTRCSILSSVPGDRAFAIRQDFKPRSGPQPISYHVDLGPAIGRVRLIPSLDSGVKFRLRNVQLAWSQPAAIQDPLVAPNDLRATVTMPRSGFVLITSHAFPGWSATVDSVETLLYRAFGTWYAVQVPAGQHRIALHYEAPGFRTGLAISLASLAGMILAVALALRTSRRHGPPSGSVSAAAKIE